MSKTKKAIFNDTEVVILRKIGVTRMPKKALSSFLDRTGGYANPDNTYLCKYDDFIFIAIDYELTIIEDGQSSA